MVQGRFVINGKDAITIHDIPGEIKRAEKEIKKGLIQMALSFGADPTVDSYSLEYDYGEGFTVIYKKSKKLTV